MTLRNGRKLMIVLSEPKLIRRVFGEDTVTSRDQRSTIRTGPETGREMGMVFGEGHVWRTHRRFAIATLRDLGMGKNCMEDTINVELAELFAILRAAGQVII